MAGADRPVGVDLFCGAGGMSLGFEQAGFVVAAAVDWDPVHTSTYAKNFQHTSVLTADLSSLSAADLRNATGIGHRHIDVVFGGPECQGFSVGGMRKRRDPRNLLLLHFSRLVGELRPSYFVVENVEGLLGDVGRPTLRKFLETMGELGYAIVEPLLVLNAALAGVPQRRRRVFILGYRQSMREPTYPVQAESQINGSTPTVWDAIGDLPEVDEFPSLLESNEFVEPLGRPSKYAAVLRGEVRDSSDRLRRRRASRLTGCRRSIHGKETKRRFAATEPGTFEPVSRFFRLHKNGIAATLRAGTGRQNGSFTAPRPIHPVAPRCITVREAARLHSYPDWFQFHETKWHGFRQVGNSVPPRLARSVAASLRSTLA